MCKKAKLDGRVTMLVVDAAQMYEVVPRADVVADTRALVSTLPARSGVLVYHTVSLHGVIRC